MGKIFTKQKRIDSISTEQGRELETFSVDITEKPYYKRLNRKQKEKLDELYDIIIDKTAIDYENPEIKDIRYAVRKMLDRIKEKANERGIFSISRVQLCGSMEERTSVWKFDKTTKSTYTEFDFLAVLNDCFESEWDSSCPGCIKFKTSPVNLNSLREHFKHNANKFIAYINEPGKVDKLFQMEIAYCLASLCDCLCVNIKDGSYRKIKFSSRPSGCRNCTIDMPTGTLEVNTAIKIQKLSGTPANCSLILLWKSKSLRLSAPIGPCTSLPRTCALGTLPIYVDFIPAFQYIGNELSNDERGNKNIIVAKQCSIRYETDGWRKSSCLAEINYMANYMSEKHRNCYKIMKYIIQETQLCSSSSHYHAKTILFNHGKTCTDSTNNLAECVVKMFCELTDAYESKELRSFNSQANLLNTKFAADYDCTAAFFRATIKRACLVSENDSWKTYADKITKVYKLCK